MVYDQNKNKIKNMIMRDDTKDKLEILIMRLKEKNPDIKNIGSKNQVIRKSFWIAKKEKLKISPNTIKQYIDWIIERLGSDINYGIGSTGIIYGDEIIDPTNFAIKYIADVGKYKEITKVVVHYSDGTEREFHYQKQQIKKQVWEGLFDYGGDGNKIVVQKGEKIGLNFRDKSSVREHFQYTFSVVEWLKNMKEYATSGKLTFWNKHTKKDIETIDMLIDRYRSLMPKV